MTEKTNKALIIIPCLNEEKHIEKLTSSLVKNNAHINAKIIIADGGSTDQTLNIIKALESKFPNVRHIHNPKKLQGAAINLAVKEYGDEAKYLIRIDAHAQYPDDYCICLLDDAENTNADSVVVAMNTMGTEPLQEAIAYAQNSILGNGGSPHRNMDQGGKYVDHGHHALMRIEAFNKVGGYDENFSHNEDAELDKRLTDAGYKIWLSKTTECIYFPRSSFAALFKQYKNYGYGRAQTLLKHKMKPKLRQIIPAAIFPLCIFTLLFGSFFPILSLPFWLWIGLSVGYGYYIGHKAEKPNVSRYAGASAMTMHLSWSIGFWHAIFDQTLKSAFNGN